MGMREKLKTLLEKIENIDSKDLKTLFDSIENNMRAKKEWHPEQYAALEKMLRGEAVNGWRLDKPTTQGDPMILNDFPKLECPFVRKTYQIDKEDFKRYGSKLLLRTPEVYLVTPTISEGYDWVITDKNAIATEKLDGTNISLNVERDKITRIQNRKNIVDLWNIKGTDFRITEGVMHAVGKGYLEQGIQYGECIGPKLQGNPYELPHHLWYPFNKAKDNLKYKSFHNHERGFYEFSDWFLYYLKSIFYCRYHKIPLSEMNTNSKVPFAEGVVFYNLEDPSKPRMAKLRRDMYPWHYWDVIRIIDLDDYWLEYAKAKNLTVKGY